MGKKMWSQFSTEGLIHSPSKGNDPRVSDACVLFSYSGVHSAKFVFLTLKSNWLSWFLLAPWLLLNFALGKVSQCFCPLTFGRGLGISTGIPCHASSAPFWIKGQILRERPLAGSSHRRIAVVGRNAQWRCWQIKSVSEGSEEEWEACIVEQLKPPTQPSFS